MLTIRSSSTIQQYSTETVSIGTYTYRSSVEAPGADGAAGQRCHKDGNKSLDASHNDQQNVDRWPARLTTHTHTHAVDVWSEKWRRPSPLLLARLMGQYCFAGWYLRRLSSSVTLPACGPAGDRARGNRAVDTARRASTVTSRWGYTL